MTPPRASLWKSGDREVPQGRYRGGVHSGQEEYRILPGDQPGGNSFPHRGVEESDRAVPTAGVWQDFTTRGRDWDDLSHGAGSEAVRTEAERRSGGAARGQQLLQQVDSLLRVSDRRSVPAEARDPVRIVAEKHALPDPVLHQ